MPDWPSVDRLALGVHLEGDLEGLFATVASLEREGVRRRVDLVLLADSLPRRQLAELRTLARAQALGLLELDQAGGAGALAELHETSEATRLGFVEAGAEFGPGAFDRLLDALDLADVGLCGPSFDRGWNEQAALREWADRPLAEASAAAERLDPTLRDLAPRYSLLTGCLFVKRSTLAQIGGIDREFGVGPCWEMDLHLRSARAGLRGVWVPQAFVRRRAPTRLRIERERQWADHSRRRYQDKFCALRRSEPTRPYAALCVGDECRHFAPPQLVRAELVRRHEQQPRDERAAFAALANASRIEVDERPLVSCLMPTADRVILVEQAVALFRRQDWPKRELVIVDEGLFPTTHLRDDPRIRLVRAPEGLDIGSKRNLGCRHASGDLLLQWDDDDWYADDRISAQVEPLLRGEAEVSGLVADLFFHLASGEFWAATPERRKQMFFADVLGGTLTCTRAAWIRAGGFPSASLAEDAGLLRRMLKAGARLARLPNADRYVYVRHATNTWNFVDQGQGWTPRVAPSQMSSADLAFYRSYAREVLHAPEWSERPRVQAPALRPSQPLVSCLMPTADRPHFVRRALEYFRRQTWDRCELVVVDEGEQPIAELLPDDPRIVYVRSRTGATLGDQRNLACERARGDLLIHWDDDDWHAPWRVAYQIERLCQHEAELTGIDRLFYLNPWANERESLAWEYVYPAGRPPWIAGGTFAYTRKLWERGRFRPLACGEDNDFVARCPAGSLERLARSDFYVGLIHPRNTSRKRLTDVRWQTRPPGQVLGLLGDDADFYRELPQMY